MEKITKIFWKLFLFTFPFSYSFVLYEKNSYRFGNFNPWVTGFLFLPEVLLGLVFLVWLIQKIKNKGLKTFKTPGWPLTLFLLFLMNAGVVTLFWGDPVLYVFFLVRVAEAGIVYLLIREQLIPHNEYITWLLYGAVFQIVLAYIQTRLNHSIGLHYLGEPVVGPDIVNVAKNDLAGGIKVIRPYGTFLHPNILGAYLMTIFYLSLPYLKKSSLIFWVILMSVGIYLTGSQAAEVATLSAAGILLVMSFMRLANRKRTLSLSIFGLLLLGNLIVYLKSSSFVIHFTSLQERLTQNVISLGMFLHQWWGVGVGNFTLMMEQYASAALPPWDFQPVHNVYFLVLNETGLQGLLLLLCVIGLLLHGYWKTGLSYFLKDKARILPFFALLIIASFDHLLWTSWVGPILVSIVIAETTRSA